MASNSVKQSNLLCNAAKLTSLNIILQISLRVCTFIANAIVLRYLDANLFGLINGHLLLLYTTCQFVCREPTRRACTSDAKSYRWNVSVNCIWLNIPSAFLLSGAIAHLWNRFVPVTGEEIINAYQNSVLLIAASVLIELLVEPFYIYGHLNGFVKSRVLIDGFTQIFRTFSMVAIVLFKTNSSQIIIYYGFIMLMSSMIYSILYCMTFYSYFRNSSVGDEEVSGLSDFLPSIHRDRQETVQLMKIVGPFFIQTVFKQLLTEGERFVMKFFDLLSLSEQGTYHAINNLSSLAARFVFAPVEESSYLVFAQLIDRNKSFDQQAKSKLKLAQRVLVQLLRSMMLFGLIIASFGLNYSHMLLLFYGGPQFASSSAVALMKWQCFYVAIIAVNGITETFTFACMSKKELLQFNYLIILLSIIFLISNFVLVNLIGACGFVLSACIQMILRIVFSFYMINKNLKKIDPIAISCLDFLPHKFIIGHLSQVFISLFMFSKILKIDLFEGSIYFTIGFLQFLLLILLVYKYEKQLVNFFLHELAKIKVD